MKKTYPEISLSSRTDAKAFDCSAVSRGLRWNPGACCRRDREDSSLDYFAGLSRVIKEFPLKTGASPGDVYRIRSGETKPGCDPARSIRAAAMVRNRDSRYARRRRSINYPDVTIGRGAAGRGKGRGRERYVRTFVTLTERGRSRALPQRWNAAVTHFLRREIAHTCGIRRDTDEDRGGPRAPGETGSMIQNTKLQKYTRGARRLSDPRAARAFSSRLAFTI